MIGGVERGQLKCSLAMLNSGLVPSHSGTVEGEITALGSLFLVVGGECIRIYHTNDGTINQWTLHGSMS